MFCSVLSKLKRVCNTCLSNDKRLKPQQAPQRRNTDTESDYDETMSDISFGTSPRKRNTSVSSIDISDEERSQSPSTAQKSTLKEEDVKVQTNIKAGTTEDASDSKVYNFCTNNFPV